LLMSISLIGIIFVQSFWIKTTLDNRERQFSLNVNQALKAVTESIKDREMRDYLAVYQKLIDSIGEPQESQLTSVFQYINRNQNTNQTFVYSHACKLLIELKEYSMAQKFADQLMAESSKNSEANNFLFTIKSAVGDPTIIDQLPKYAKTVDEKILSKGILKISRKLKGEKSVEDLFSGLPRSLDKQPDFISAKCELWMANEDHIKAETELKKSIPTYWDENHISLYSKLHLSSTEGLSSQLETWLKERPRDSNLWLAASRIARREGLWSKAKQCIERSIEFKDGTQKQTELALILAQLGEKDEAFDLLSNISEKDV